MARINIKAHGAIDLPINQRFILFLSSSRATIEGVRITRGLTVERSDIEPLIRIENPSTTSTTIDYVISGNRIIIPVNDVVISEAIAISNAVEIANAVEIKNQISEAKIARSVVIGNYYIAHPDEVPEAEHPADLQKILEKIGV